MAGPADRFCWLSIAMVYLVKPVCFACPHPQMCLECDWCYTILKPNSILCICVYQQVQFYFLSKDWAASKWHPVLMYGSSSQINTAKWCKTFIDENLIYCNAKCTPKVPLILLTVEKIKCKKNWFCSFFVSPFSSFPSCIAHKVYCIYEQYAHQTTALLSEIFLFLFKTACKVRLASYGSKHTSWNFFLMPFCACLHAWLEDERSYKKLYLTNDLSTNGDIYFLG